VYCFFSRLCSVSFHRLSAVHKEAYPEERSASSSSEDDFTDKPIKFSTSGANQHRAYDTFFRQSNAPWYQGHIVVGSVVVFLLYFCVFREENDIDERLGQTIWQRVPALREQTLRADIKAGRHAGIDVSELEKELDELHEKYK